MNNLGRTKTRNICYIKPNIETIPGETDLKYSMQQLRCAGVVAAVTISRVAFPNRLPHETALTRFSCLAIQSYAVDEPKKAQVLGLMKLLLSDFKVEGNASAQVTPYVCGESRVYFKAGALEYLESKRLKKLVILATTLQRIVLYVVI